LGRILALPSLLNDTGDDLISCLDSSLTDLLTLFFAECFVPVFLTTFPAEVLTFPADLILAVFFVVFVVLAMLISNTELGSLLILSNGRQM